MTEVERIIEEGVLDRHFIKPEMICDFYVDEKRKKMWAICIDLLVKFDKVCRSHNLRYSLAFGSLLGYARHNGFIPWDDDIDVVMPRADYEKLKEYKHEFQEPYFLQYPGYDNGYCFSFAKLRNSNTSGVSWAFRYETFNQGMFLDIFPLDNYSSTNLEDNLLRINKLIAECSVKMRRSCPFPDENDKQKLAQYPIVKSVSYLSKELDNALRINEPFGSDKYIVWCISVYDFRKKIFNKYLFDDLVDIDFYGHLIKVPIHFDEVLKIIYGNYMQYPPIDQRGCWHSSSLFNPDVPYKETISELKKKDNSLNK